MNKENILNEAKESVGKICSIIEEVGLNTASWLKAAKARYHRASGVDSIVEGQLIEFNDKRLEELQYLKGSPFFVRCDVLMDNDNKEVSLYFGKFNFSESGIYSWVAPASAMRFESPGQIQYVRPDGGIQGAELRRKDQFMIIDGGIKFLASESIGSPRELIYQDQFSNRKSGFVLPEIIAQMEKAQDQVIRAHHTGPLVISGPAGSGKTTLALHRVAFLLQSPDLENLFSGDTTLVLVQDRSTKDYFSALLPGLGINNVSIDTFPEWALSILGLENKYEMRIGTTEKEMDLYEHAKLSAIRKDNDFSYDARNIYDILTRIYKPYFNEEQKEALSKQAADKILDKIDLTVLLKIFKKTYGSLGGLREYHEVENGKLKKKQSFISLDYSLIIIDEFQNYLPEQLSLIKSCVNRQTQAIVYVGDMAQQVQLGTIKGFNEIKEDIRPERKVILQKVYRNTKKILEYINCLGYKVEIPESIKEGLPVMEKNVSSAEDGVLFIKDVLRSKDYASVGILATNKVELSEYKKLFSNDLRVHTMTMNEAQGVEFDIVFLVDINDRTFKIEYEGELLSDLIKEKQKINRDLLYVALTRAISELYVLGSISLKEQKTILTE